MPTEKFKALTHFIVHECRDNPSRLGAVRLNKALWYADVIAYKQRGESITGDEYLKRPKGPVPAKILKALNELKDEEKILIQEPEHQYDPRKFHSLGAPDEADLSDDDRDIANSVLNFVCGQTANGISEISHDLIWDAAGIGEPIPLFATLASTQGEITQDVLEWADARIPA